MKPCLVHLCPEKHTMAKMAKNRQKASDSNWMPKVATWRGDFGENGNFWQNWQKFAKDEFLKEAPSLVTNLAKHLSWVSPMFKLDN